MNIPIQNYVTQFVQLRNMGKFAKERKEQYFRCKSEGKSSSPYGIQTKSNLNYCTCKKLLFQ